MDTTTVENSIDFEALWAAAEKPASQSDFQQMSMTDKDVPDYLLPQSILNWFEDIADRCLKEGLIDETQHGLLLRGGRDQSTVFSSIDAVKLRSVLVSIGVE